MATRSTAALEAMEESPTWEAQNSSGGWPVPQEARRGPTLSSILNELPSAATLRYRGPGMLPWGALEEEQEEDEGKSMKAFTGAAQKELQEPCCSRELPWPMQARRVHRQRYARDQEAQGSGSRAAGWARLLRRSKEKMSEGLRSLQPWGWTLKRIGGQFGAGTESYFSLLRFLLVLNVLASLLTACMTLLPTWLEGAPPGPPGHETLPCNSYNPYPQGLVTFPTQLFNLLSGEGYLEWSPLFYGFYPPRPRLAITYLCSVFVIGLIYLLLILHRSVYGLKQTLLAESGALTSYSYQVFSAWDFGLCGDVHVRLRQRILLYELQVELEEADVRRRAAVRTLGQKLRVWLVRALLNLLVVALLGAAFYGVYWATGYAVELQETSVVQNIPLLRLGVNYLPSIFISVVNFVLPPVFALIAPLEGYTRSRQIVFILLRTVFLRLTSLVVLLFSLWNQITCGGDGQDEECKTCGYNYKELPLTLFSTCSPASRTFRASTVNFFFPLVLLLGLAISAVPVLYSIFLIPPSKPCGPFRGQSSIWSQIPDSISSLPQTAQNFFFFLGTQAFAVPLLLISSILMAYTVALANSYGRLISELKRQIETETQNKVFLAQRAVALSSTNKTL
ncbi:transmembrane channel-like protein 4 isoform X2 [Nycticebus coucang]|uniref:transmembrane channel-like protein 4 isoform X2 n=1 Tax=Nycticebus coucang TaxID=9470 RepID=UPI00234C246A|nr:transmembrane channel-like protein 4 isoform X2 [Nycticebus coucang]